MNNNNKNIDGKILTVKDAMKNGDSMGHININNNNNIKDDINNNNQKNNYIDKNKSNKKISFHEEENIIIKYNEKEEATEIFLFDAINRPKKRNPRNINVYFSKLKKFKPKSVLINSNIKNNNNNNKTNNNIKNINKLKSKSKSTTNLLIKKNEKNDLKKGNNTKAKTPKKEICPKFKENPQFFYTEKLCDSVIKSLGLEEKNENNKVNKINNTTNNNKERDIFKGIDMKAYHNLKEYLENNKFEYN